MFHDKSASTITSLDPEKVLAALRRVVPAGSEPVALHEPSFAGREWEYLKDCLDSGWVSSVGSYVDRFEQMLAEICEVSHAIATVNGTAALHLALVLSGVEAGDEVLMPGLTFIATANAAAYCGATPHFIDSDEDTLGLDMDKLADHLQTKAHVTGGVARNKETGRRIGAIVPMHTFGHPVDMDALTEIALRWNIPVVEDAAESLGSTYKGRPAGGLSQVGALSFNGNKIVTTGGGGAVLCRDANMAARAKHLSTTAKIPHKWAFDHDAVGYNYRLPNINAALGCAQLEQLAGFVSAKRVLAERYLDAFVDVPGVRLFREPEYARSNYWLNTLILDHANKDARDNLLEFTSANGVMTRPVWTPMHRLPMYADAPRMDLAGCESLSDRVISIPSSAVMGMVEREMSC